MALNAKWSKNAISPDVWMNSVEDRKQEELDSGPNPGQLFLCLYYSVYRNSISSVMWRKCLYVLLFIKMKGTFPIDLKFLIEALHAELSFGLISGGKSN